jgi:hypothetical protein
LASHDRGGSFHVARDLIRICRIAVVLEQLAPIRTDQKELKDMVYGSVCFALSN